MISHAEIYRRVCEARPECAIDCLFDDVPLSTITDFWTEMLPSYCDLWKWEDWDGVNEKEKTGWRVGLSTGNGNTDGCGPTRFHALAEFLVPGSTKEKV